MKIKDITNQRFGKLVAVKFTRIKTIHAYWLCQCDCGKKKEIACTHLIQGKIVSCGCLQGRKKSESKSWRGYGEISGSMFSAIKNQALKRNYEFNVTIEYLWQLFLNQNRRCALSQTEIDMPEKSKAKHSASLDRIDNSKGYIKGNVQWLHKDINQMKNSFNQEYFLDLCCAVSNACM